MEIKTNKSWLKKSFFTNIALLMQCVEDVKTKLKVRPEIKVFGKICHQNRDVGFFSDESIGYKYSGYMAESIPLTSALKTLLDIVNEITNNNFNGILVNYYCDGTQTIGAHSDDESELGKNGVVAISYGTNRKFRIRDKVTKKILKDIDLENGDMVHMGGDFQKEFTHEIPAQRKIKDFRYSFTFRYHKN